MFLGANKFDGDISRWNTSNVTDMRGMFKGAYKFNGNIGEWDTSKVTNMSEMFLSAYDFNSGISRWDTSDVRDMSRMFKDAKKFDCNLTDWFFGFCDQTEQFDGCHIQERHKAVPGKRERDLAKSLGKNINNVKDEFEKPFE